MLPMNESEVYTRHPFSLLRSSAVAQQQQQLLLLLLLLLLLHQ